MYYRCNAGGWNRSHGQVEQTPRLDSFELPMGKPWEIMYCGCPDRGDKPVEVDAEADTAFIYPLKHGKGFRLKLSHKRNGYGGEQVFFLCPECGARVRFLYLQGGRFICRKCAGLNYHTQQQTEDSMTDFYKGMEYAEKFLTVPPWPVDGFSFLDFIPDRPRYMRRTTYHKHLKKFLQYRERYTKRLLEDMARIVGQFK